MNWNLIKACIVLCFFDYFFLSISRLLSTGNNSCAPILQYVQIMWEFSHQYSTIKYFKTWQQVYPFYSHTYLNWYFYVNYLRFWVLVWMRLEWGFCLFGVCCFWFVFFFQLGIIFIKLFYKYQVIFWNTWFTHKSVFKI